MQPWRLTQLAVLTGALTLVGVAPLNGQGPRLTPTFPMAVEPRIAPGTLVSADSTSAGGTYWVEGGIIGAVAGVALAEVLNGFACQDNSDCGSGRAVLFGVLGGFVVGSLIGGGIKKGS